MDRYLASGRTIRGDASLGASLQPQDWMQAEDRRDRRSVT